MKPIVHSKMLQYKYGQIFRLKPIFDIHLGNSHCDEHAFHKYLADTDDDTRYIGGGDLFDSVVVPDARYRKSSDKTEGDDILDEQVEMGCDYLTPYKDKILGLGSGNHEDTVLCRCGTNLVARVCAKLDVPFLGYSWLFRLGFTEGGMRGRTLIIRGHHGWGGGSRTQGADLTKYSKDMAYWDADLFLYGHVHKRQADKIPRLGLVGERIVSNPKTIVICGTFLKTYSETEDPTYSEIKGYPPTEIGGVDINLKPLNHQNRVEVKVHI